MKKVNEELLDMLGIIVDKLGYRLVPTEPAMQPVTWSLLSEEERAGFEAMGVEDLNKKLKMASDSIIEIQRQSETGRSVLQDFLKKNMANKAVESVAQGYGWTIPAGIIEADWEQMPKLMQQQAFLKELIFKKSLEELSKSYGNKIEYLPRGGISKFVIKI